MRHDYNLPPEWDGMTPEEKDTWFKQERAFRQALRQDTAWARHVRKLMQRQQRRETARAGTVPVRR